MNRSGFEPPTKSFSGFCSTNCATYFSAIGLEPILKNEIDFKSTASTSSAKQIIKKSRDRFELS